MFKNRIFPFNYDEAWEEQMRFEREEKERLNNMKNKNGLIDYKILHNYIIINDELVRKYFLVQDLGSLLKKLQRLKKNREKNKIQADLINSGLKDLKKEIEDMSEEEKKTENPNEIVNLVEKILEFNRQQQGQGPKILTPNQMLSRLPISLAQLKARQGLKTDVLKILYTNLVKEQELEKQYCSKNNAEKLLKDLKRLVDTSDYDEFSKELKEYAKLLNSNILKEITSKLNKLL